MRVPPLRQHSHAPRTARPGPRFAQAVPLASLCRGRTTHTRAEPAGGSRRQSDGPLEAQCKRCALLVEPLEVPSAVSRRVASHQASRGDYSQAQDRDLITRAARAVDARCPCLCGLDAPGLPSRVPSDLGMPFGLSTPGGQPVAVCCRVPLLLACSLVLCRAHCLCSVLCLSTSHRKCPD